MPVDPQLQPLLDAFAPFISIDWAGVDVGIVRQLAAQSQPPPIDVAIAGTSDFGIPGPTADIPARLYRPTNNTPLPVTLFFHGGGWVMGSIETYDSFCRILALKSGCAILSVDYRLAPEHPYPAAIEDCFAALSWLHATAHELGLDPDRIAVAGDSAGGNLATVCAYLSRERAGPQLRHQLLLYPVTDAACDSESFQQNDRYLLTPAMMRWYWRNYLGERAPAEAPLAVPAGFDLRAGVAPATVITAEYDPLRDEGEAYAAALGRAGVPTELVRVPGMIHGFASMQGVIDAADEWLGYIARRLRHALE